ncbi:MAG: hypothetical protein ACK4RG_06585 [Fimbriimonadales bacterium]
MRRWIRTIEIIGVALLILSGCSNQASELASAPPDRGTALQPAAPPAPKAAPSEAEPAQDALANRELTQDFPLPLYAQFQVKRRMQTTAGDFRGVQLEIVGDATPQAVAEFYEAEFTKRGLKISKMTQHSQEGEEHLVLGQSETITAGVAVTKRGNQARAVLSWSEKARKNDEP